MKGGFKLLTLILCLLIFCNVGHAQIVRHGKISFERRTNLYKQFDDERMKKFIKEENKIKIDKFNLVFNDSVSLFTYVVPDVEDQMSWATLKNTVYNNFNRNNRMVFMDMFGTSMIVNDSLVNRMWKITDKTRKIAGYECTRAIWQKNDTTRIYAWFTTDIAPTIGPESIQGLPGAVLGLATEDGGIVYFATKVEDVEITPEMMVLPKKKGKEFTEQELRKDLFDKLKGQPMGNRIVEGLFYW